MVAGTHSGCGKTTLALALMASLRERGFRVQPFKVGPDFIDPGFHNAVTGADSRNLDGWMLSREYNRRLFQKHLNRADAGVIEGVMGLFDGYDGRSESGSSAEMAKWLNIPVVLVVDARSMARSAAALVHGFQSFDPGLRFAGVLFNRVGGAGHLKYLQEAMEGLPGALPVLGGIPRDDEITLPERHLGLVTAEETPLSEDWIGRLTRLVDEHVDVDQLIQRCRWAGPPKQADLDPWEATRLQLSGTSELEPRRVPIAVARDAAFCFYYPDNFEWLEAFGASLKFFSPLAGESLPADACGLYLGGGYPELFAQTLSRQEDFLDALRRAAAHGMPIYAECGGLMVLGRFIETLEKERFPMAGLLPFATRMLSRRKALGYTEVLLREPCLLGPSGTVLRGHEFHYSEIVDLEEMDSLKQLYELRKRKHVAARREGYSKGSILASYIHLHWGSAPEAAASFVAHCREFGRKV